MKILIIGAGRMGSSIINAWHLALPKKYSVSIVETDSKRRDLIKKKYKRFKVYSNIPLGWRGNFLFLAIKPQDFDKTAQAINRKVSQIEFIISIMAGIKITYIRTKTKVASKIIRIMPNIATEICQGMTCMFSKNKINKQNSEEFENILKPMGKYTWLKKENLIDAVTSISGSGPAYFFLFLKLLTKASKNLGLDRKLSSLIVIQTAIGSMEMVKKDKNLNKLINRVTSKGGTTEAALKVFLSNENNLEEIIKKGVLAAKKKSLLLTNEIDNE